jgi:hypothetical protein
MVSAAFAADPQNTGIFLILIYSKTDFNTFLLKFALFFSDILPFSQKM